MRKRRNGAWLAVGLCLAPWLPGCRTMGLHASQGGVSVTSGEIEVSCDVHNGQVRYWFTGATIASSRGPITRTVFQMGVDQNGNGVLDPTEVTTSIDNQHPGPTSTIAAFQGSMGAGSTVIAHVEVFTGGSTPTFSRTYKHR